MANYISQHTGQQIDTAVGRVAVSASGTSSEGWGYRKWTDGKCELWLTTQVTPTESAASGSGYRSNTINLPTLPFAVTNATVTGTAETMSFVTNPTLSASGLTLSIRLMRYAEVSTTTAYTVHISVDGNWQ